MLRAAQAEQLRLIRQVKLPLGTMRSIAARFNVALCVLFLCLVSFAAGVQALVGEATLLDEAGFVEDFEGYASVTQPDPEGEEYVWLQSGGGVGFVSTQIKQQGAKSMKLDTGSGVAGVGNTAHDMCSGQAWDWWVYFTNLTSITYMGIQNGGSTNLGSGNNDALVIKIKTDGSVDLYGTVVGSSAIEATTTGITVGTDQWYNFRIYDLKCSVNDRPFTVCEITQEACGTGKFDLQLASVSTGLDSLVVKAPAGTAYLDNVTWTVAPEALGSFGSQATYTSPTSDILSFDMNTKGNYGIIREGGAQIVKGLEGGGLTVTGSDDTDCTVQHNIAAGDDIEGAGGGNFQYAVCASGDGSDITGYQFKSHNFQNAVEPSGCGDECIAFIPDEEISGSDDDRLLIQQIEQIPIGFFERSSNGIYEASAFVAFAYSDVNGNAGVVSYTGRNNADDLSEQKRWIAANAPVDEICTAVDPSTQQTWMYAAEAQSPVTGAKVTVKIDRSDLIDDVDVTVAKKFTGGSTLSGAYGVDCAGPYVAAWMPAKDKIEVWKRSSSELHSFWCSVPVSDSLVRDRGLAISEFNYFVAYEDDAGGHVISIQNATDGNCPEVATFSATSGTWKDIEIDSTAQNVWVATNTQVVRYEVYQATTGTPLAPGEQPPTGAEVTGDGAITIDPVALEDQGIFGSLVQGSAVMFGPVGGRFFVAMILVLGMAGIGAGTGAAQIRFTDRGSVSLGMITGAVLGFIFAIATGVFPKEWAFIGVLVAVVGAVIWKSIAAARST